MKGAALAVPVGAAEGEYLLLASGKELLAGEFGRGVQVEFVFFSTRRNVGGFEGV